MHDVVIVGAGLAGSTTAAALSTQGWDVLLVERDQFPRHKVCGEFLSPESQSSLQRLRLYDEIAALNPQPLYEAQITAASGAALCTPLPAAAWGLSRYALDDALAQAAVARGATLWTQSRVTRITPDPDGWDVYLRRDGEPVTVRARTVIMAAGRRTTAELPPYKNGDRSNPWSRCVGVKVHYTGVDMPARVEIYYVPGGYIGLNPVENGHANACMLITYDAFERAGRSVMGAVEMTIDHHPTLARTLAPASTLPETECSVAPVDTLRPSQPWVSTACVGDTAAMIPPLVGDGMAMALRSAELCAPLADEYLRGAISIEDWRVQYEFQWHAEFNARLRNSRLLQSALGTRWLANAVIQAGRLLPPVTQKVVRATRGRV